MDINKLRTSNFFSIIRNQDFNTLFIYIISLVFFRFYSWVELSPTIVKLCSFIAPIVIILQTKKILIRRTNNVMFNLMRWLFLSFCISIISSFIFWNQPLLNCYRASYSLFIILFFFYFYKSKLEPSFFYKYCYFFGFLYCILWTYAMLRFPTLTFGNPDDEMSENMTRGMIRVNLTGILFLIICFFISLNNYIIRRKLLFLILGIFFYIFILLQLTRQLILWSSVVALLYFISKKTRMFIFLFLVSLICFMLFGKITLSDDSILGSMVELSESQYSNSISHGEDPRIMEYIYFFNNFSKSFITDIIGNGIPHMESSYGHMYANLIDTKGIYLSDVGYPTIFVYFGYIGLLLFISLYAKCLTSTIPPDLQWAKMFILFLFFANFTADWCLKPDGQLITSLCVYIIFRYKKYHAI